MLHRMNAGSIEMAPQVLYDVTTIDSFIVYIIAVYYLTLASI